MKKIIFGLIGIVLIWFSFKVYKEYQFRTAIFQMIEAERSKPQPPFELSDFRMLTIAPNVEMVIAPSDDRWEMADQQQGIKDQVNYERNKDFKNLLKHLPSEFQGMNTASMGRDKPIDFYGRFVDQYNDPVPDAHLRFIFSVSQYGGGWLNYTVYTKTDSDGRFHLSGAKAHYFTLHGFEKLGYIGRKLGSNSRERNNKPATSYANPEVFSAWKYNVEELELEDELIKSWYVARTEDRKNIVPDGSLYTADIIAGEDSLNFRKGSDGDIVIQILGMWERDKNKNFVSFSSIGFEYNIEFKNGSGIAEIDNKVYPYVAPKEGYINTISSKGKKSDDDWHEVNRKTKRYFLRTPSGHYGLLRFSIDPVFRVDEAGLSFRAIINTSGETSLLSKRTVREHQDEYKKGRPDIPTSQFYKN